MIDAFVDQYILTDDDIDNAIHNTIEVAEKCAAFEIKKQKIFLPKVPGYNVKTHLTIFMIFVVKNLKR